MSLRGRRQGATLEARTEEFLIVMCEATHFAIATDAVRSVVGSEDGDVDRVLAAFGITQPPSHLAEHFGLPGSYLSPDSRLLICQGEQGRHGAFRVDQVLGLRDVRVQDIQPLPAHFIGPERQWFRGVCLFDDTVAVVVNMGSLLAKGATVGGMTQFATNSLSEVSSPYAGMQKKTFSTGDAWQSIELEEAGDGDDAPWAEI